MKKSALASFEKNGAVLGKAFFHAADALGLKQSEIAQVVGVSRLLISRLRSGKIQFKRASKQWELAVLFVRLYRSLDGVVAGDEKTAKAWMRIRNKNLHGVPAKMIQRVTGLVGTLMYVDTIRAHI